jgi:hypothetical protein
VPGRTGGNARAGERWQMLSGSPDPELRDNRLLRLDAGAALRELKAYSGELKKDNFTRTFKVGSLFFFVAQF